MLDYFKRLCSILRAPPLQQEPLSKHTSLGIGGPVDCLVYPCDLKELQTVLGFAQEQQIPLLTLGHGTNLLVSDDGFRGIALNLIKMCSYYNFDDIKVKAGASVALPLLAREIADRGLSGLEFAAGIPGTVGGAIYMNAGAFGCYTGDLVEEVVALDLKGHCHKRTRDDLKFAYRWSSFQDENSIILEATLALKPGHRKEIDKLLSAMLEERAFKHPRQPSAGSVFRNPPEQGAGSLIEQAGLKGKSIGGAQISPQHGNFIVNTGDATAADVLRLIDIAKERVREKFGIELQLEIRVVGGNRENRGED